jgi:hypothetical protein
MAGTSDFYTRRLITVVIVLSLAITRAIYSCLTSTKTGILDL